VCEIIGRLAQSVQTGRNASYGRMDAFYVGLYASRQTPNKFNGVEGWSVTHAPVEDGRVRGITRRGA